MKALVLEQDSTLNASIRVVNLNEPIKLIDKYWYNHGGKNSCFAAATFHVDDEPILKEYVVALNEIKAQYDSVTKKLYAYKRTPLL